MRRLLILPACAFLAACSTAPDIQVTCPPAMSFTPQEWGALATEWTALGKLHMNDKPPYLTTTKFIHGAMKENQANEACAASQKAK